MEGINIDKPVVDKGQSEEISSKKEILKYISERGQREDQSDIYDLIGKSKGLDNEVAKALIDIGFGSFQMGVAYHLGSYRNLGIEVAKKLIDDKSDRDDGYRKEIAYHIDSFSPENQAEIISMLISSGYGENVGQNLVKVQTLLSEDIAVALIDDKNEYGVAMSIGDVVANLDKFIISDYKEMARKLISLSCGKWCVAYLGKFKGLTRKDLDDIVADLIKNGSDESIDNLDEITRW